MHAFGVDGRYGCRPDVALPQDSWGLSRKLLSRRSSSALRTVPRRPTPPRPPPRTCFDTVAAGTAGRDNFPAGTYRHVRRLHRRHPRSHHLGPPRGPGRLQKSTLLFTSSRDRQCVQGLQVRRTDHPTHGLPVQLDLPHVDSVRPHPAARWATRRTSPSTCASSFQQQYYDPDRHPAPARRHLRSERLPTPSSTVRPPQSRASERRRHRPTITFERGLLPVLHVRPHARQAIVNTGESWTFETCVFEPKTNTTPAAIIIESGVATLDPRGLAIRKGCWLADKRVECLRRLNQVPWLRPHRQRRLPPERRDQLREGHEGLLWRHSHGNRFRGSDSAFEYTTAGVDASVSNVAIDNDQNGGATPLFRSTTYPSGIIQGLDYGEVFPASHATASPTRTKGRMILEVLATLLGRATDRAGRVERRLGHLHDPGRSTQDGGRRRRDPAIWSRRRARPTPRSGAQRRACCARTRNW